MKLFGLKVICDYQAQIEFRMRFPLPFVDWRACSILLLRYHTGRRRIEWEVWRWNSTPGTDDSMAALRQTRAAMLWSVKQKYDPSSKSLIWPFAPFLGGLSLHLNHLIASHMTNYDWSFGTLPFGLFGSNLDTRDLETYPRTYSGHFWNMSIFDNSRAILVLFRKWVVSENQSFLDEGAIITPLLV